MVCFVPFVLLKQIMEPLFSGRCAHSTKKTNVTYYLEKKLLATQKTQLSVGSLLRFIARAIHWGANIDIYQLIQASEASYKIEFFVMTLAFKQMKNWIDSLRKNLEIIVCTVCQKFNFCPKIRFSRNLTNSLIWIFAPKFKRIHEF